MSVDHRKVNGSSGRGYAIRRRRSGTCRISSTMRIAAAIATIAALCGLATAQVPAQQRMVVVISLDGFPAFALDDPKLPIPTLRRLIRDGVSARMTTVNPTVTW